jgi:hypothetical protein
MQAKRSFERVIVVAGLPKFVENVKIPESKKRWPKRDNEKVHCETSEGSGSRSLSLKSGTGASVRKEGL